MECSGIPTDLKLKVGGHSIDVHRFVLMARSPVFKNMLNGLFKEKDMDIIDLPDIDHETFNEFLNLLYYRTYIASPALMTLVHIYGVIGVTLDMLHKQFDVPCEQFVDYIEVMTSLYPTPLPQRVIDTIASKITSSTYRMYIDKIPLDIKDRIWGSKKFHFYGNTWDKTVQTLLSDAELEKKEGHKLVYTLDDNLDSICAYGRADALLKLRGERRRNQSKDIKMILYEYERGITPEMLKDNPQNLPKLKPGTRYVINDAGDYDVVDDITPSCSMLDEIAQDYFEKLSVELGISGDFDLKDFIGLRTKNTINPLKLSDILPVKYTIYVQHDKVRMPWNTTSTILDDIHEDRHRFAFFRSSDEDTFCIGRFEIDTNVIHSLSPYNTKCIKEKYGMRTIGPTDPIHTRTPFYIRISERIVVDLALTVAYECDTNGMITDVIGLYDMLSEKIVPCPVEVRTVATLYINTHVDV